jgi:hypothetical protein
MKAYTPTPDPVRKPESKGVDPSAPRKASWIEHAIMPVSAAAKEAGKEVGIGHALADVGLLAASFIPVAGQVFRAGLVGRAAVQGGVAAVKAGSAAATKAATANAASSTVRSAAARSTAAKAGNKAVVREAATGKPALSSLTAANAPKGNLAARAVTATGTAAKETVKGTGRAVKGAWQAAGQEGAKQGVIKKTAREAGIVAGAQATRLSTDEGYRNFVGERIKQSYEQGGIVGGALAAAAPILGPASDRVAYADYLGQPTYTGKGSKGVQTKTNPDGTPYQAPAGVRTGAFVADIFNPISVLAGTAAVAGALKAGGAAYRAAKPGIDTARARAQANRTMRDVKKYQNLENTYDPVKDAAKNLPRDTKFTEQATAATAQQGQTGAQNAARVFSQEQAKIAPGAKDLLRKTQGIDDAAEIVGGTPAANMQGPLISGRNIPGQGGRGLSDPRADVPRGRDGVGGAPRNKELTLEDLVEGRGGPAPRDIVDGGGPPTSGGGGGVGGSGGGRGRPSGGGGQSGGGSQGTGRQTGLDTSGSSAGTSGQGPGVTNQVGTIQQAGVTTVQNAPVKLSQEAISNFSQKVADRMGGRTLDSSNVAGGVSNRQVAGMEVVEQLKFGTPPHSRVLAPTVQPVIPRSPITTRPPAPSTPGAPARPTTPTPSQPVTPGPVQRNWYLPSPTLGYQSNVTPYPMTDPNATPQPQPQPNPDVKAPPQVRDDVAFRDDVQSQRVTPAPTPRPEYRTPPPVFPPPPVGTSGNPPVVTPPPPPPLIPILGQEGDSGPAGLHRGWWGGTDVSYMPAAAVSSRSARMVSNQRAAASASLPSAYTGQTPGTPYGAPEAYTGREEEEERNR